MASEADFGYEERLDGVGAMVLLRLRDEFNQDIDMEVADVELLTNDINEGNWVYFDKDNKIYKEE